MKEAAFSKRQQYWNTVIADQRSSGLSQAKFCDDRGISKSSFSYWSSMLKKKGQSSFAVVKSQKDVEASPLKIVFASGAALHFASEPEAKWIAEILRLIS